MRVEARRLSAPVLAIHGGAGRHHGSGADTEAGLRAALDAGWAVLEAGGPALDAAIAAVASMEDSGVFNAGRGAVPTTAGTVETDAAVMGVLPDGREVSGAACAVTWPANPVHLAREIAMAGDALLVAGAGGDELASAYGLARREPAAGGVGGGGGGVSQMGTVGAVALDRAGALAAATSTGGRAGQRPGRVGDTPIIGAGTWADQGRVAVSATGEGEAFVRAGFAHRVDWAAGAGVGRGQLEEPEGRDRLERPDRLEGPDRLDRLQEAAVSALQAVARWGGRGGAVVLGAGGDMVALYDTEAMAWGWRSPEEVVAEVVRRG